MNKPDASAGIAATLFRWWADHPLAQVMVFLLFTSLAVMGHVNPTWVTSQLSRIVNHNRDSAANEQSVAQPRRKSAVPEGPAAPRNVQPFQIGGGQCVLVARIADSESGDIFTNAHLTALRRVADEMERLPQVRSVMWLDNIPGFNLFGLSGTLMPSENASTRQMNAARDRVLANPLAVGQLISKDGRTVLMQLQIDWFHATSDEAVTTEIRKTAEAVEAKIPHAAIEFQLTGPVPLHLMMANNHVTDSFKYQMIGYAIMLLSAIVLFRGFSAVLIVAIAPAVGVAWTNGILHYFDLQDNPFNDIIVPVLISLVGLTDSVHLMVEIRQQRANGLPVREAARRGIARVGMACFLTSTTTAIGFLSLLWAHHEVVREFGMCCVVGVVMTFVSVLTVIPLGCRSPLGKRLHIGLGKSVIDSQLRRIGPLVDWVLRRDKAVAWIAIVATAVLVLISLQLEPDEKRYSGLSESGEAAQALRHLDRSLGGLEFSSVNVRWYDVSNDGELLKVLGEVDALLAKEPLIGNPIGVGQLLAALPGAGDSAERMSLLELLPGSIKRAFYSPERQNASIQFRVQDLGIAAYSDSFARIETGLQQIVDRHPNFDLSLDGNAVDRWRNIYQIVTDLATSLGTASLVIWLVLTLVYRSLRIGLISIVPNVFPLASTAAILVLCGEHLEIVTVCVFTICVGIAVDDTIHFLTRYQEEAKCGGDHKTVIRRAFTGVGSALLMTTIVLIAGLASAIIGDSRDARIFGIMGCLTLATALFADVVLLPAMLSRFAKPPTASKIDES
ncbi:efflux RND transporter permease subunit [Stieleria sp. TO1_6]|uniref:efflux RND transporter permease subunit n=1 Tax=Stieleria tagensis TaxID=2956795 RepID=UPI00209B8CEB|nr:efflux RND transporter permease subunit [Stieleria tagensis]MCO8124375.1 efflux RND transporter permease subunit [Stieleria tagensis]